MHSVLKVFNYQQKSENGFVLIAAIMAVMIIMAVGFFILTTTTQDIRISSRLVGERKALSAAEAGIQAFCAKFYPGIPGEANTQFDPLNDPKALYSFTTPVQNQKLPEILAKTSNYADGMVDLVLNSDVTGTDTAYGSSATFTIGLSYGPVPAGTQYK